MAVGIGGHRQAPNRSIAADRERNQFILVFHHGAHHLPAHQQTAEGCRRDGTRVMAVARGLHGFACRNRKRANHAVGRDAAYQVVVRPELLLREIDDAAVQSRFPP